jgi:hypothetical protein
MFSLLWAKPYSGASKRRELKSTRPHSHCQVIAWGIAVRVEHRARTLGLLAFRSFYILQFRIPISPTAFWRQIENGPQRHRIGRAVRILSRIGGFPGFTCPEMVHFASDFVPNIQRRPLAAIGSEAAIIGGKIIADALIEFEIPPTPFTGESKLARDRRSPDDRQRNALFEIDGGNIK